MVAVKLKIFNNLINTPLESFATKLLNNMTSYFKE